MLSLRIIFVFIISLFLTEAQALRIIENTDFGYRADGKLGAYPNGKAYNYTTKTNDQVRGQDQNQSHFTIDVKKTQNNLTTVFESKYRKNTDGNPSGEERSIDFESIHVTTLDGQKVTSYTMCSRSIESLKFKFKNLQNVTSCMTVNSNLCSKFTAEMKKSNNPNDQKDRAYIFLNEYFRTDLGYQMSAKSGMTVAISYTDEILNNPESTATTKSQNGSKESLWGQFKDSFVDKVTETQNDPTGLLKDKKKFESENITDLVFRKCQELEFTPKINSVSTRPSL